MRSKKKLIFQCVCFCVFQEFCSKEEEKKNLSTEVKLSGAEIHNMILHSNLTRDIASIAHIRPNVSNKLSDSYHFFVVGLEMQVYGFRTIREIPPIKSVSSSVVSYLSKISYF